MKKAKAASSSRAQASAFGAAAFGGTDAFPRASSHFGATRASQISHVYEPPDLTAISDPALIVALKNLQKKDSTTKSKALDELLAYAAQASEGKQTLDEEFLDAWVKLYPRTSIDNARQVRQRAHNFQGRIAVIFGKRIAKSLPSLIGAWVCGLHDNDKLVVRAAQDALQAVFPTEEKRSGLWKAYHRSIVEYCSNAVLQEDVKSLSDERTTSKDDADAKYNRTVASAILTVAHAITLLEPGILLQEAGLYKSLLDNEKFWALCESSDSFVRQSVYKATAVRAERLDSTIDADSLTKLSKVLLNKAIRKDQAGAILQYTQTLAILTSRYPVIWTSSFASQKKSAADLLSRFLKALPAGLNVEFWDGVKRLLESIPAEVLAPVVEKGETSPQTSSSIPLSALRQSLARKENFRPAPPQGWQVLLSTARRTFPLTDNFTVRELLAEENFFPLIRQYVFQEFENSGWTVEGSSDTQKALSEASLRLVLEFAAVAALDFLRSLSADAVEVMKTSLPEQAQGFPASQANVTAVFERWIAVKKCARQHNETLKAAVDTMTRRELRSAIELLVSRNGKPFGAAATIKNILKALPTDLISDKELKDEVTTFVLEKGIHMWDPSLKVYERCLNNVIQQPPSLTRSKTLEGFLRSAWPSSHVESDKLSQFVFDEADAFGKGEGARAPQLQALLANTSAPKETTDKVLTSLMATLAVEEMAEPALETLSAATTQNSDLIEQFLKKSERYYFDTKLLLMSQSSQQPNVRALAADLRSQTQILGRNRDNSQASIAALVQTIHNGLYDTRNPSMTVDVLVDIAKQTLESADEAKAVAHRFLLQTDFDWETVMSKFVGIPPDPSVALLNSLGGAIHWLASRRTGAEVKHESVEYDSRGQSVLLRAVRYVVGLLDQVNIEKSIPSSDLESLLVRLTVFNQIAADQVNVTAPVPIWSTPSSNEDDMVELLAQSQALVSRALTTTTSLTLAVLERVLQQSAGDSVIAYYYARAYVSMADGLLEADSSALQFPEEELLQVVRKPVPSFQIVAKFATASQGSGRFKVVNSLAAEMTRFDFTTKHETGLYLLTYFNCMLRSPLFDDSSFNQQHRLVLFVKHMVAELSAVKDSSLWCSELLRIVLATAPMIKDIFDNFWTQLLDHLIETLHGRLQDVLTLEPALRLAIKLSTMVTDEETNDDLKDTWEERKRDLVSALTKLLQTQSTVSEAHHQPQRNVNAILARALDKIDVSSTDSSGLIPVIAAGSPSLQRAALKILHKKIPAEQEQVNFDAALTKEYVARIPGKLFALISEAPSEVHDLAGAASLPNHLARYLYAWELIFDHWTGASYQVQNDYFNTVKEADHLPHLLDLVFEVAINSRTKPLDASKIPFESIDPILDEPPQQECNVRICHLYFLALKHLPRLVRAWLSDSCPRALKKAAESWTEQYFSPSVIAAELAEVAAWSVKQETETPLEVKIQHRAHEVTAMYPLDEQMSAVKVVLPSNYPIGTISVESVNRVGVDEKKWRSWLMIAQGVMNFTPSSGGIGAIADGLVGYRRNVVGTLQGHGECAICYSVINADRELPNKRCLTCKNLFHGSCLFKWFRNSGGSTCPLCRTQFNFQHGEKDRVRRTDDHGR